MSTYTERTVIRRETRIIDFSNLDDQMKLNLHTALVRDGYFREQTVLDTASVTFGPNRVTYYKWLEID